MPGACKMAAIAGGTSTCATSMEKLSHPQASGLDQRHGVGRRGGLEADAEEHHPPGGVVARDVHGVQRRVDHAHVGAAALSASRSPREPGTRSMSPNEVKMTSGKAAMACARSMVSSAVTQTGQPGPCTSSTSGGKMRSMP